MPALYPWLMLAAVLGGSYLLRRFQSSLVLSPEQKLAIGIGAFCGAMLGSKIPMVLAQWPNLLTANVWFAHGKTILAGMVGGYFGVEVAKKIVGVTISTGDSFVVPVAFAVAVGRVGCFVGGCCHGCLTTVPWGVDFGRDGDPAGTLRHPTQLYEAAFHLTMAVILYLLLRRRCFAGQLIKLYLIIYLIFRFVTEWLRPEPQILWSLTAYQWASLLLIPVFTWLWIRDQQARLSSDC